MIAHAVDAYAEVRPNLLLHAKGYPEAAALKAAIRAGSNEFGMKGVGPGKLSDGAKLLLEAAAKPDPGRSG